MKNILLSLAILFGAASVSEAQVAGPGSRLAWDQAAGSLGQAQSYIYEAFWDGGNATPIAGVACAGTTSPFVCSGNFAALTPGEHSVRVRAVDTASVAGTRLESPLSAVFNFTLVALPAAPTNVRIVPGNN